MQLFSNEEIKTEEATPSELVLRLYVRQLEANYKEGWLYYQCKDKGLLQIHQEFMTNGIFKLLKEGKEDGGSQKLRIELVLKTCWFSNVRSNVDQEQWNFLKKVTAKKACYRCEICGGQGQKWPVECHEIWNYDDESLIQKLVGLISLCPSCHKVKHMGFAELSGKSIETKCHLAIVNSWSYKETGEYVDQQFKIWRERSKCTR